MPSKRSDRGASAEPAATYAEWRARAAALLERQSLLPGVMWERDWRRLYLRGVTPEDSFRSSGFINQLIAVKAGLGIAVLPCYLAEPAAGIRRVLSPIDSLLTELWLITHRSLKDTARVRVLMDSIGDGVRGKIAALEHGA
jgi:DNA-binding transcriptional LysR family regulator